jgi:hypothetical protein
MKRSNLLILLFLIILFVALLAYHKLTRHQSAAEPITLTNITLDVTAFDSEKGKGLFVKKGCVICHSVNDVGGTAAPALNAADKLEKVDVMEFTARMWRGAPAMISLQRIELGYDVYFTGEELAALAAFGSDRDMQSTFTIEDVPEPIRDWFLDELYMQEEDWVSRFLKEEWPDYTTEPPEENDDTQ